MSSIMMYITVVLLLIFWLLMSHNVLVTARCDNTGYDTCKPQCSCVNTFTELWKDCRLCNCWTSRDMQLADDLWGGHWVFYSFVVVIIRPRHIDLSMRPLAIDVILSLVCVSVHWAHRWAVQKWLNQLRHCLGWTRLDSRNLVFDGGPTPSMGRGTFDNGTPWVVLAIINRTVEL